MAGDRGLRVFFVVDGTGYSLGEEAATAVMLPRATAALLDLAEQEAQQYLKRHLISLQDAGVSITTGVLRGDPVTDIIDSAIRTGTDLIVMATHGKTGLKAFWSGSAAPNVATRSMIPLLLVPVDGEEPGKTL